MTEQARKDFIRLPPPEFDYHDDGLVSVIRHMIYEVIGTYVYRSPSVYMQFISRHHEIINLFYGLGGWEHHKEELGAIIRANIHEINLTVEEEESLRLQQQLEQGRRDGVVVSGDLVVRNAQEELERATINTRWKVCAVVK